MDTNIKHRCSPEVFLWVNAHRPFICSSVLCTILCLLKLQSLNCVGTLWKPWVTACPLKDPGIKWFAHYDLCSYTLNRLHLSLFITSSNLHDSHPSPPLGIHHFSVSAYSLFTTSCRLCSWLFTVYILFVTWFEYKLRLHVSRSKLVSGAHHKEMNNTRMSNFFNMDA